MNETEQDGGYILTEFLMATLIFGLIVVAAAGLLSQFSRVIAMSGTNERVRLAFMELYVAGEALSSSLDQVEPNSIGASGFALRSRPQISDSDPAATIVQLDRATSHLQLTVTSGDSERIWDLSEFDEGSFVYLVTEDGSVSWDDNPRATAEIAAARLDLRANSRLWPILLWTNLR